MKTGAKKSFLNRVASVVASAALIAAGLSASPAQAATYPYYPACTIQGTEADETLTGTYGNDVICTGGGNDIVFAGAGDDIVIAENGGSVDADLGTGNDIFDGTNGSDAVVDGEEGDDELIGTPGADELNGQEGDDSLLGGASSDRLNGGAGADDLKGQAGDDYILGEAGDDTIDGGSGTDDIYGGSENDVLVGGSEGDTVHGGDGNDNLAGDAGDDNLFGESGTDQLSGGDGDDIVAGGDGVDALDGGWGLNACDHTATEPRTSTCTYDDDAPVVSNFSFDRSSYEVGVSAAEVTMTFNITDATGLDYMSIVCWGNDTANYPISISINRQDPAIYTIWGGVNSETTFEYSGNPKNLHVVAKTKVPFGAKPGRYDCNYYGRDMASQVANRWVQIANLDVTRQSGSYDDDAPVVSNFSFDQSSYEVGTSAAEVTMTFDITDATGLDYMSIVCWGNDTASYPISISINRQADASYFIGGTIHSQTTFEYSGDSKNLHFVVKTKVPFGAKPGRYDCNYYGRDMASQVANRWVQIANLDLTRQSGSYDDDAPVVSNFSFDRSNYEVGTSAAEVTMTFDITDATGLEHMSIVCWGNDTASYPISISINRQDERYNIWGSTNSETSFVYTGDTKNLNVVAKTKIPFGAKPGRYDCNYYGHDRAGLVANRWVQFANLDVFRTPAGMPSAPANLRLTQDRSGRGVLSWDAPATLGSPNLRDYVIQVSEDGTTWKTIEDGYSTTTNLPVSNLKNSTDYWFRVRGENGGAAGQNTAFMTLAWSNLQVRTIGATAPFAVQGLTASERTRDGFKVTWAEPEFNGGERINNFVVDVSTDNGATWRSAKDTESTSLSYRVGGAAPGTTYLVRVAATNKIGTGEFVTTSVTTLAAVAKAPTNLTVTNVGLRSLSLGWSLPASNGGSPILDYKIEFSSNGGTTWNELAHNASPSRSFNVTGLLRGKNYLFKVAAINEVGVGASSVAVSATTLIAPATAPQSLTSTSSATAAQFSWLAPADNGGASVTSYRVEYSKDGLTWLTLAAKSTAASFKLSGLTPGATYQVRVAATTRAGLGAFLTGSITTPKIVASAPGQLRALEISQTSLTLAWSLPALNGGAPITDYQVEVSANGGSTWKVVPHEAANNLSIQVTGLPSGTNRLFRVAAVNEVGVGAYSSQISATTLGYRPSAPTSLRVTSRGATSVSIAWNQQQALGGSPIRNFVIEYSKNGGYTWLAVKRPNSTALSATISGFTSKSSYRIRVRATNDVGTSGFSNELRVTTR
jgi:Ca2+-binding RTX toxin-like protein